MTDASSYTPPKVWQWDSESGGRFASINRPTAGPTQEKDLPVGVEPGGVVSRNGKWAAVGVGEAAAPELVFVNLEGLAFGFFT